MSVRTQRHLTVQGLAWNLLLACVFAIALFASTSVAQSQDKISATDRVMVATEIYHQISTFFPDLQQKAFDQRYAEYLKIVLNPSDDRRDFDLASMALVATLHDGHTWFYDSWLGKTYGQPIDFAVYPLGEKWVVMQSHLASLKVGDIIEAVDGTPTKTYFERNEKFISASSGRDAGISLFDTPVLFPMRFNVMLDGGRQERTSRLPDLPLNIGQTKWATLQINN